MRILLHGLNYAPELTGIGKYSGEMMEWLAERGHEVRVVTAPPYYPAWKVRGDYRWWAYRREISPAGSRITRCPLWVPREPRGLSRMIHLGSFALSSIPPMLAMAGWSPDVVITVEPTFFSAPMTLLTAALCGAASWLHIQDFEVDAAFDLGILPRHGPVHALALSWEKTMLRLFRHISSISPNMVKRIAAKGADPSKAVLFPNWVDTEAVYPMRGRNGFRDQLGLKDEQVVLLYSGNMGMKQNLEVLPQLARELAGRDDLHFVFCGEGAFRPQLEQLTAGLGNVSLLPLQPLERLNELLNAADIHLLPQSGRAADLVMPSKLTGMLASGRPVIATVAAGTQVAHAMEGCGIAVDPGDHAALRGAVECLAADRGLRERMGEAARQYAVLHLGREEVLRRFEAEMVTLVKQTPEYSLT
ncbi:MAG TPA: glycosyltransferase WbuB [Acidobacteriaceae bacterium]|nr:glycosyltransferase WbuB [Acidobacteriaceae bacterium]HUB17491.1 glycosyltransferase WbuB [Acidobacteriaceae bacterium]